MKRALIVGAAGQDGTYLAELLLGKGYQVFGLVRSEHSPRAVEFAHAFPAVRMLVGDLVDFSSLLTAIDTAQPDEVYNLAGVTFVAHAEESMLHTTDTTAKGAHNVLEAVRLTDKEIRYFQASSSEIFGLVEEVPQNEHTHVHPRAPYGVAKVFAHYMTMTYRETFGLHASSGILYNHESPRRGKEFVSRKVTDAVARISLGLADSVTLGNLDARRDWGFAGDYVEAMWLMLQQDEADDYVIATGVTHSIRELLSVAFDEVGIAEWEHFVKQDPRFMRPSEAKQLVGDASKAERVLGWKPRRDFEDVIRDMVRHDVALLSADTPGRS